MTDKHKSCPSHCCKNHGCKYGHEDCPVAAGKVVQKYLCERCGYDFMDDALNTQVIVTLIIKKERTNMVTDLGWLPDTDDVRREVADALVGKDLDTGWVVAQVR